MNQKLTIDPVLAARDLDLIKERQGYFFAAGINTEKFTALELYQLETIITDHPAVQMAWRSKVDDWHRQPRPVVADADPFKDAMSFVPPKRLLLAAIRELSPERKAEIRRAVLEKKEGLGS